MIRPVLAEFISELLPSASVSNEIPGSVADQTFAQIFQTIEGNAKAFDMGPKDKETTDYQVRRDDDETQATTEQKPAEEEARKKDPVDQQKDKNLKDGNSENANKQETANANNSEKAEEITQPAEKKPEDGDEQKASDEKVVD